MITIEIPEIAFDVLKKWASVSRTMDTAIKLISHIDKEKHGDILEEEGIYCEQELKDLKYSLNACNDACKQKYFQLDVNRQLFQIGINIQKEKEK